MDRKLVKGNMEISRNFNQLSFHDASVLSIERGDEKIEVFFDFIIVVPEHPDAKGKMVELRNAKVTFLKIKSERALIWYDDKSQRDHPNPDVPVDEIMNSTQKGEYFHFDGFWQRTDWTEWYIYTDNFIASGSPKVQLQDIEGKVVSATKDFASSINSSAKLVADMSSLTKETSELPLTNIDYWERLIRKEFSNALENAAPPKWKVWAKPSQQLTWLDLISWDGYRREKTLRAISGAAPNAFFLCLAIRRLNDWVPQVREAARDKLPLIAKETSPEHVVSSLCLTLANWHSWGRMEEADKQVLLKIMSRQEVAEAFRLKLVSSSSGPMPSLFSQLGRTSILEEYLDEIAELSVQPTVRAKAYRSLLEGRMFWVEGRKWEWTDIRYCEGKYKTIVSERKLSVSTPLLDLIKRSAKDRSPIVRRVAAEFLIRHLDELGEQALSFAEYFASDKSGSVSERGRFALKKLKNTS